MTTIMSYLNSFVLTAKAVSPEVTPTQVNISEEANDTQTTTEVEFIKTFIYLTQTEQCLPVNLATSSEIGDPETCNCDVIVLSFQNKCQDQKSPHITYLFDPNTGWGTGRNALYFAAITRKPGYHYYIFLDEDVFLTYNEFTPPEMRKLKPFRVVEKWLLDYEPVVGVLNYGGHHSARWTFGRRQAVCGITEKSLVIPTVWFDGVFNAHHYKSIQQLFPYRVQYEKISWWSIHRYLFSAVELKFRGQALMFVPVTPGNPTHRGYPKSLKDIQIYWRDYIETIKKDTPAVYRNRSIFEDFKQNLTKYVINTSTYCMNVTRHQPIVPYAHFERDSLSK